MSKVLPVFPQFLTANLQDSGSVSEETEGQQVGVSCPRSQTLWVMSQGLIWALTPKHIVFLFLNVHTFIMFYHGDVQGRGVHTQARWLECIGSLDDRASCLHLSAQQSYGRYVGAFEFPVCSHFSPHLTFIKDLKRWKYLSLKTHVLWFLNIKDTT